MLEGTSLRSQGTIVRLRAAVCLLLLATTACAPPRKLLLFPREMPTPAELRAHVAAWERAPFDGLVLDAAVANRDRTLAWLVWGRHAVLPADLEPAALDLAATHFRRFHDNFLRVNVAPGDVDWFDTEWGTVASNLGVAAAMAKRAGLRGLVLDTEQYAPSRPFDYASQVLRDRHSFAEYAGQARRRGAQASAAIAAAFPDVTLLVTFGHTLCDRRARGDVHALAGVEYGLLAPFLDGVLEGLGPRARYVDAFESAYPFRERAQFARARRQIRSEAAEISGVPELYRKRVQAGFGLWLDFESDRRGWDLRAPKKNYFSPEGFGQALRGALAETDGYVWVYSEKPNWLTGQDLPPAYIAALEAARY
jgi:hypothetical protein